ncbi:MAG: response regulator transcription factor [Verrucomicrobiota bacterium]
MSKDTDKPFSKRLILVEDNRNFREALAMQLEPDFEVVGSYGSAEAAFRALRQNEKPDLILLDLGLPGIGGLEAIGGFKDLAPEADVVILTQFDDRPRVFEAISAGASGYLLKNTPVHRIVGELRSIAEGGAPLNSQIAKMVLTTFSRMIPKTGEGESLTQREQEVLVLLSEGLMRKEIADRLNLSPHTVDVHIRNVYSKLQVNNVTTAIREAIRRGLL